MIIPLMRADAMRRHWMTSGQFLNVAGGCSLAIGHPYRDVRGLQDGLHDAGQVGPNESGSTASLAGHQARSG